MSFDDEIARRFLAQRVRFFHADNIAHLRQHLRARALLCRAALMKGDPRFHAFLLRYAG